MLKAAAPKLGFVTEDELTASSIQPRSGGT
jgi:hypothetical protein